MYYFYGVIIKYSYDKKKGDMGSKISWFSRTLTHYTPNIEEYSGYYAFDALWIKIDELGNKWVFLLALADVLHNTLVAYKIVEKETEEEVL